MLLDQVRDRIVAAVDELPESRVKFAAELAELVRRDALPNSPLSAFLLLAGSRGIDTGSAGTGFFIQSIEETVAVVLIFNAASDVTGGKTVAREDAIEAAIKAAIAGWMPDGDNGRIYTTDFRFQSSNVASLVAGRVIYQLEFVIGLQLRILA